jgi:hypothetical protein
VRSKDCANAGDAMLTAASAAMRASFDLFIMVFTPGSKRTRPNAIAAHCPENTFVQWAILNWATKKETINKAALPSGYRSRSFHGSFRLNE